MTLERRGIKSAVRRNSGMRKTERECPYNSQIITSRSSFDRTFLIISLYRVEKKNEFFTEVSLDFCVDMTAKIYNIINNIYNCKGIFMIKEICSRHEVLFAKRYYFWWGFENSQILRRTEFPSWTKAKARSLIFGMCTSKVRFELFHITIWCLRAPRINWEDGQTTFSARSWQRASSLALSFFLSFSRRYSAHR